MTLEEARALATARYGKRAAVCTFRCRTPGVPAVDADGNQLDDPGVRRFSLDLGRRDDPVFEASTLDEAFEMAEEHFAAERGVAGAVGRLRAVANRTAHGGVIHPSRKDGTGLNRDGRPASATFRSGGRRP